MITPRNDEAGAAAGHRKGKGMKPSNVQATSCWEIVEAVAPRARRLLLFGPPGTGKTHAALRHGLSADQPVFSITLTEETPAAEVRGHYVPVGDRFVWQDGPGIAAWRAGGRLVVNELDHAGADLLSFLLVLLDDPESAYVTLPHGELVHPAPGFGVVATMNGDPESLPAPLRDRFPFTIEIDAVHPEALERLPNDIRSAARSTAALPEERRVSLRAWLAFTDVRQALGEPVAARAVFGKRAVDVLDALRLARA